MQTQFSLDETLYRAVKPAAMFWKEDDTISSAALKDSHGASVDRLGDRSEMEAIDAMHEKRPESGIISVTCQDCQDVNAVVKYKPMDDNLYHSEIHSSNGKITLTSSQRKNLAKKAIIKLRPASIG